MHGGVAGVGRQLPPLCRSSRHSGIDPRFGPRVASLLPDDSQTAPYCLLLRPQSPCRRGPLDLARWGCTGRQDFSTQVLATLSRHNGIPGQLMMFCGRPCGRVGVEKERDRLASLPCFWPLYDVFVNFCQKHHMLAKWPAYGVFLRRRRGFTEYWVRRRRRRIVEALENHNL
jgi:hypothetical protein